MYEQILYEVADPMATITLNRPERLNAWTNQMSADSLSAPMTTPSLGRSRRTFQEGGVVRFSPSGLLGSGRSWAKSGRTKNASARVSRARRMASSGMW